MEELSSTLTVAEASLKSLNQIIAAILERLILEAKKEEDKSILGKFKSYTDQGGKIYTISIDQDFKDFFEEYLNIERVISYKCVSVEDPTKFQYLIKDRDVSTMLPYLKESLSLAKGQDNKLKNKIINYDFSANKILADVLTNAKKKVAIKDKERKSLKSTKRDNGGRKYD